MRCSGCSNSKTEINISITQMITLKCAACRHVLDFDMRDKLTMLILKSPPAKKAGKDKRSLRRAEKKRLKVGEEVEEDMKMVKKESKEKGHKATKQRRSSDEDPLADSPTEEDNGDDDVQWQTDNSVEAAEQGTKEQLNSVTSRMVMLDTYEDNEKAKSTKNSSGKNGEFEVDNKSIGESYKLSQECGPNVVQIESNVNNLHLWSILDAVVLAFKDSIKNENTLIQLASFMPASIGPPLEIMNAYLEALLDSVGKGFSKKLSKNKMYLSEVVQDENSQLHFVTIHVLKL